MKKHTNRTLKSIVIASFITGIIGTSTDVKASTQPDSTKQNKPAITYSGEKDKLLMFSVDYNNINGEPFHLELTAEGHQLLYHGKFTDKNFHKKLYLKNEPDDCKITFTLRNKKEVHKETFRINKLRREEMELVVVSL